MLPKGISDIRRMRSLNTRSGPITESSELLKLYQLAAEKDNLMKKREWVRRQQDQTEKRLSEIAYAMQAIKKTIEEKAKREAISNPHSRFRNTIIKY
ncbi:MAG: hypothetical protein ACXVCD_19720 [Pseudobdellovibrionaceae bacterium]|jgi:hypothetical protein